MQTTIKSVDVEWVGSGAKKYGKAVVKHVGDKGEKTQYLVSYKNPDVFKKVQEMVGQTVEVDLKKDGDFWQWVSINVSGTGSANVSSPASGAGTNRVSGSNYETREERAARQWMIAKQSSLDRAVQVLSHNNPKDKVDVEGAIELAGKFFEFVTEGYDIKSNTLRLNLLGNVEDMDDDIPF